jgi:hypothetical protein
MGTAFVFDPKGNYQVVRKIRDAEKMPATGLRYVASVTGPYKVFQVVDFDALAELGDRLDSLPGAGGSNDPPNVIALGAGAAKVRRSTYLANTALVRIDVSVADPRALMDAIEQAIESSEHPPEADAVVGDFDILACVVADDEAALETKLLNLRGIEGVARTVTLRVIDYVSTSEHAPDEHRVAPAD